MRMEEADTTIRSMLYLRPKPNRRQRDRKSVEQIWGALA